MLFIEEEAPNLVIKKKLLEGAIRFSHTQTNPVMFDLSRDLVTFAEDTGEYIRIAAAKLRELGDSQAKREAAFRVALTASVVINVHQHGQ